MISLPPFPIFIFNIYYVSFVCFWRQFPVARSCWHSCSVWVDPAVSTRLCYNGWGSDGQEEAGLWVCDSAFPCGFSHNKHRPLRVESFFQPFWDLLSEDFTAWQDTAGMGWEDSCICGILCLVLAGCGVLWFFMCYFSAPAPGPIINVCQPPRPHCCLCPIDPPVRIATQLFSAITYAGSWGSAGLPWALFLSLPSAVGSDTPTFGSQCLMSLICVLSRELFVELWLPSL